MRQLSLDDPHAPLFTVGQVADLLGVDQPFLRRLDARGTVTPARTAGGQRRYSRHDLDHIADVTGLIAQGLSLTHADRMISLQREVERLRREVDQSAPAGVRTTTRDQGNEINESR